MYCVSDSERRAVSWAVVTTACLSKVGMTTQSDGVRILEAAQVLSACRQAGALVLPVCGPDKRWRLYILNDRKVPDGLKARLMELRPAGMAHSDAKVTSAASVGL